MSKYSLIGGIFLIILSFSSYSRQSEDTFSLTVRVEKLRNSAGTVKFGLYNRDGSIPDQSFKKCYRVMSAEIVNCKSTVTFYNIPKGKYAVTILHDENNNGKIERGIILPQEGIGFSNFKTIDLSNRPSFAKASFDLKTDSDILIQLVYM